MEPVFKASGQCVLYARYSPTVEGKDSPSSIAQIERMEEWAAVEQMLVRSRHHDDGVSGAILERPGLWDAITALKRGDRLICCNNERLSRDMINFVLIERDVEGRGCRLGFVEGFSEGDDPNSKLIRNIMLAIGDYGRCQILYRANMGRLRKRNSMGYIGGKPPYGWKVRGFRRKAHLVRHEGETEIMRFVDGLRERGLKFPEIAHQLNTAGYRQRNESKWRGANVADRYRTWTRLSALQEKNDANSST